MALELPAPPASGIVTDAAGIEWRVNSAGRWSPSACPTCGTVLPGDLPWPQLLEQRGQLTPVTGGV